MPAYILAPTAMLALIAWAAIRIHRAEQISDDLSHGDWPHVPAEMLGGDATVRKSRRGAAVSANSGVGSCRTGHIAHDGSSN